jgi:hypothetical protein
MFSTPFLYVSTDDDDTCKDEKVKRGGEGKI